MSRIHSFNQHLLGIARFLAAAVSVLLLLSASRAAEVDSTSVQISKTKDRFSFTLPAGWREMPPGVAAMLTNPTKAPRTGGGIYAFELAANSNSMALPWVTIQVLRRGRIADGYVAMLKNPEVRRRATLDMLKGQGVANQDVTEVGFDTNRTMLRFNPTWRTGGWKPLFSGLEHAETPYFTG